jgi:hypothetical protein
MISLADLRPGDIGFGTIHGFAGDWIVGPGQIAVAPWKHQLTWRTWWRTRHAVMVTQAADADFTVMARPDGTAATHGRGPSIAQAMPHGMEEIEAGAEHWTAEWTYIRPRWLYPEQPDTAVWNTRQLVSRKIPYNWLDYAAIAAHRLHLPVPHLDRYVSAVDAAGYPLRAICSQAVDACLTMAGGLDGQGNVFNDHRLPGDVVPSELYLQLLYLGPEWIARPGAAQTTMRGMKLTGSWRKQWL